MNFYRTVCTVVTKEEIDRRVSKLSSCSLCLLHTNVG